MVTAGALLVAGTTSDAGKSVLVAGICRWLHRRGVDVAPFKAQNMSNNSVVCADGGEIGRAQALQAAACGLAPSVGFNPVLLKPGSDRTSQVVVRGVVDGTVSAASYRERKAALLEVVTSSLASLREQHEVVICEGAGSPAEINLRATDIANMGLARAADLPVIVVGDIDRGGVLAHLFGTLARPRARRPGAGRGLGGEQVPRRPGAARARPRAAPGADRPPDAGRRAVEPGAVARRRGLAGPRRRRGRGTARAAGRARLAAGGGGAPAAGVQRHGRRRAGRRARGRRPLRHRALAPRRRRPRRPARLQGDGGRPRLAARAGARRRGPRPRPRRAAGARGLRRLPDALPAHPRSARRRGRAGHRRGPRPARRRGDLRRRQAPRDADGDGAGGAGGVLRDPPRAGAALGRRARW